MDDENRLDVRKIEIAFRGRERVLVTGGIEAGERLVVSPLPGPVPGMALRLEENPGDASSVGRSASVPPEKDVQR
jgi:hypothetical protein